MEEKMKSLSIDPTPTLTPTPTPTCGVGWSKVGGVVTGEPGEQVAICGYVNLACSEVGQYCFHDMLNGKPSYKHKDIDFYIYWKQGYWNVGRDRNLTGYVSILSNDSEPPLFGWKNTVGFNRFDGVPIIVPDTFNNLTLVPIALCPTPTPTPTNTPPGWTPPPTKTPTKTPTPTKTATPGPTPTITETLGPTATPTATPGPTSSPTTTPGPTASPHIPAGYIISGSCITEDLGCCGSLGQGGEVHLMWDGFNEPDTGGGAYILFDDNINISSPVTLEEGSKFDHYAIEWIEIHEDDSVHAFLSERKQICHYPGTNVASSFFTIGKPKKARLAENCKPISETSVKCGACEYKEDWCTYRISYNPPFDDIKYFGGINWEAMKYISSLTISKNGENGPLGANTSFYSGPYFRSPTTNIEGSYGGLSSGSGKDVFDRILANSYILKDFITSGQYDILATVEERMNLLADPFTGGSDDPCCSANDLEFMNGNCPKEPTNDWWIVPDCNCERFPEDPGYGAGGPFGTEIQCYRNTICGSSFRCSSGVCKETYFGFYPSLEECIVNCPVPRITPQPTPVLTTYYYKCQDGTCIDCEETPEECTDKDCEESNYYCSFIKDNAQSDCDSGCDSPEPTPSPSPSPTPPCSGTCYWEWMGSDWELTDEGFSCNLCLNGGTCAPKPDREGTVGEQVEVECTPGEAKWVFDRCEGNQPVCTEAAPGRPGDKFDTRLECESSQTNIDLCVYSSFISPIEDKVIDW